MGKLFALTLLTAGVLAVSGVLIVWAINAIRAVFDADRKAARDARADADDALYNLERATKRKKGK